MRRQLRSALLIAGVVAAGTTAAEVDPRLAGAPATADDGGQKKMSASETRRLLRKQITVAAPIEEVWRAWTTEEGLKFVSSKSNVRLEIGGPYEWFLDLDPDEQGKRGGEGAVIHAFLEPEMLAFSWTFPPSIPSLRSAGATTRVVVRFRSSDGGTHIDFRQLGWREGDDWDAGYAYFDDAWDLVLARLRSHLEGQASARAGHPAVNLDALTAEVESTEKAFAQTVANRDLEGFRAFLHPDAVFTGGSGELRGAAQVVSAWSRFFEPDAVPLEWEPDRVAVDAEGRLAISTGPYWMEIAGEDGSTQRVGGRFFSVWKRAEDATWKVLFDSGTEPAPLD